MARQADHPHVMAEVLPAELGADAGLPGHLEHLLLQPQVPEGPPVLVIHGAGGGFDQALHTAQMFGSGFQWVAPSRFGYLGTPLPGLVLIALGLVVWSSMTALSGSARSFSQLAMARVGVGIGVSA